MKTVNEKRRIELDIAIAYFMGWRIDNSFPDKGRVWRNGNSVEMDSTLKFSSDWNALMNVYETVNLMDKYYCRFYPGRCEIQERAGAEDELKWEAPHKEPPISTQEAVYRCLGEFIEWYNESQIKTS